SRAPSCSSPRTSSWNGACCAASAEESSSPSAPDRRDRGNPPPAFAAAPPRCTLGFPPRARGSGSSGEANGGGMTGPASAETATIQATIDGHEVTVPAGTRILDAARDLGIDIPTLCHHDTLAPSASCRLCVVEVEGRPNLLPACA